jgi:transcriptional regulator with XRE-family HTH domain
MSAFLDWLPSTQMKQFAERLRILREAHKIAQTRLAGLQAVKSAPKVRNPKLYALYEQMDALSDEDHQALITRMDSLVKYSRVRKALAA